MIAIVMGALWGLAAQSGQPPQPSAPATVDCGDATRRAIGFWVGQWTVTDTATSTPVADSRIEWTVEGCAIRENYEQRIGPNGRPMRYAGASHTAYDAADGKWKQFYVDSNGRAAWLTGTLQDRRLVLNGQAGARLTRMTIRALPNGDVRQSGEASTDGGGHWQPTFDFTYRRK